MSRASWWMPERRRVSAAAGVAAATALTWAWGVPPEAGFLGHVMVLLAAYLAAYVALTFVVFARVPDHECRTWAASTRPGTRIGRWLLGTQPGAGLATGVSGFALVAVLAGLSATFWTDLRLPTGFAVIVVAILLVSSWLAVTLTYAVEYLCRDQREPGVQLSFPGDEDAAWADYLYFSFAVSTTFGTTDVDVRKTTMRRTVTGHAVISFLFNTVILAVAIGAMA